jgi:cytochrome c-type biogenesis protein CcmF
MISFILTLLGTFLTRSSVLESVHNFTATGIGPTFFVAIVISLVFTIALLSFRMERLVPDPQPVAMVSRESAFLLNNLLFVAFTFTVLVGTLFPLVVEAVNDDRISMGRPFFDSVSVPICVALVFLMGIGPVLPWGRPTPEIMKRRLAMPVAVGLSVGVAVFAWGMRSGWGIATFALSAMAMSVSVREMLLPGLARRAAGEPMFTALFNGARSSRRRFAGHIVHVGVVLVAVGITASSIYREDVRVSLPIDEPVDVLGYTLEFKELKEVSEPHLTAEVAVIDVSRDGDDLGQLEPRNNQYFMMVNGRAMPRDEMPTPAVRSGLDEDLYLTILGSGPDSEGREAVTIRVIVEPLMAWLWYGGLLMVLGSFIAAYPSKKNGTV